MAFLSPTLRRRAWLLALFSPTALVACEFPFDEDPPPSNRSTASNGSSPLPTAFPERPIAPFEAPPVTAEVKLPGQWKAIPGVPAGCGARLSQEPRKVVSPIDWRPCTSGTVGCLQADGTSREDRDTGRKPLLHDGIVEDAGGIHIAYFTLKGGAPLSVVQKLDGEAELVGTTADSSCLLRVGVTESGIGMVAWSSDGLHRHSWAITSPFASPLSTAVRTLTESAGGRGFETSFGPGFVALWWSDEFRTVPLQGTTGDLSAWQPGTVVATVDGGVFALDTEKTVVSFKPISGAPVEVIRASPGLRIGYFALDRKDGNRLVWVETVGDAHDGLLFTAPFTTGRVEGRSFLTHLPEVRQWPLHGVTHDGRLAYAAYSAEGVDDNTLRVVRLRDGRRWDVEKSANHKAALFVSASTLVSYEGIEIPGFHSGAWPLTLVRRSAPTGEPPIAPY